MSTCLSRPRSRGGLHAPASLRSPALWALVLPSPSAALWRRVDGVFVLVSTGGVR